MSRDYGDTKAHLRDFCRAAWDIIEPGKTMLWNWHLDLLCEYLELITIGAKPCDAWCEVYGERDEITQLIVNEPPGHMKSTIVSVMWPCWEWTSRPEMRTIFSTHAHSLSIQHAEHRRSILSSGWYITGMREHWGQPEFALTRDTQVEVWNTRMGKMQTTSTGGSVQGFHGDHIIIDDPTDPKQASSTLEREKANTHFDQELSQRVSDKNRPVYVILMQRLEVEDLTGHVLGKHTSHWVHVRLPSPAVKDETLVFPRSGRTVERKGGGTIGSPGKDFEIVGDILWPEREGAAAIEDAKANLGSWAFDGQYLQEPVPLGGGILKRDWWQRGIPPAKFERIIQSWDCAFKSTKTSDFVACVIIGQNGADRWILDVINARMDFVETCQKIRDVTTKWPRAETKLIEDKANGSAVMSALKREVTGMLGIDPEGGKLSRAMAVSPQVEAGNWHIPADAPWASDFIEQAAAFRGDDKGHDDMVDAFTQGANWLSGGSIWDYYA